MRLLGLSFIAAAVLLHFAMVDWTSSGANLVGINGYGFRATTTLVESGPGQWGRAERTESSRTLCAVFGLAVPALLLGAGLSIQVGASLKQSARNYIKAAGLDRLT